jgi:hypothetical protein
MLFKGVCEASRSFAQIDPRIGDRQLDLVRSALVVSDSERPLRGRTPTLEDLERAFPSPEAPEQAVN